MPKAIDLYEAWMRIEERSLNTIETQIALAALAKEYSEADSSIITDFRPFISSKLFNNN